MYPVGLRLQDRRVVVVGGGQVAHRRVAGLLEAGARVTVVSPEVTPALEARITRGSLSWVRRRYEPGDLDGAWYAVAATDDHAVNAAVLEPQADLVHDGGGTGVRRRVGAQRTSSGRCCAHRISGRRLRAYLTSWKVTSHAFRYGNS